MKVYPKYFAVFSPRESFSD